MSVQQQRRARFEEVFDQYARNIMEYIEGSEVVTEQLLEMKKHLLRIFDNATAEKWL